MTSASSEDRRASLGHILRNALSRQSSRRPSENLQFSDLQKMASDSAGNTASEEIVLRPKLLKRQSRTESVSTPPQTPKIQLNGRAAQLMSIGRESVDADGKYADLKDSPTLPVTRRRSVFARLKTFVIKSHSLDDADVEENSFEDGKVKNHIFKSSISSVVIPNKEDFRLFSFKNALNTLAYLEYTQDLIIVTTIAGLLYSHYY